MRFAVSKTFLTLREEGKQLRQELEEHLRNAEAGDIVEIAFEGTKGLGGSATDEFLGKLLTARAAGDIPDVAFVLTGLNEDTAFEVNMCLSHRGAAAVWAADDHAELLGGDAYLKETFKKAAVHGEFLATVLAEELSVTPQNLNNRLKRLVDEGALLRHRDPEANGKQFIYRVPAPA